jgi:adenine-specific DNA methylase
MSSYIGSKARLAPGILKLAAPALPGRSIDAFPGSSVVSRETAVRSWQTVANDFVFASTIMTTPQMISRNDVAFRILGGYEQSINKLNARRKSRGLLKRGVL